MTTEQQYRVIGKSGPGVEPKFRMVVRYRLTNSVPYALSWENCVCINQGEAAADWAAGNYEILEAISSPQAAVATCESWCGLPFGDKRVPCASDHPSIVVESHAMAALCEESYRIADCPHPAYCTQACLDRAKGTKAPECIRSACKIPPVAGGELCAAHAGQVEAVKAAARPATPAPAETRLERWRREHKGYSHGTADPRLHDANVAAMMVGIDGPRSPYVPLPKPDHWTPREVDMDIPDAHELGGTRLGGTR